MALLPVCNQFSVAKTKTSFLDLEAIDMGPECQTNGEKLGGPSYGDLEVSGGSVFLKISEW